MILEVVLSGFEPLDRCFWGFNSSNTDLRLALRQLAPQASVFLDR